MVIHLKCSKGSCQLVNLRKCLGFMGGSSLPFHHNLQITSSFSAHLGGNLSVTRVPKGMWYGHLLWVVSPFGSGWGASAAVIFLFWLVASIWHFWSCIMRRCDCFHYFRICSSWDPRGEGLKYLKISQIILQVMTTRAQRKDLTVWSLVFSFLK